MCSATAVGEYRTRGIGVVAISSNDVTSHPQDAPHEMARMDLESYDGVLAFGESLAEIWRQDFEQPHVWTLHEAADTTTFHPREAEPEDDVIWIGNWGDEERSDELRRFWLGAARALPEREDRSAPGFGEHVPDFLLRPAL